MCSLWDSTSTTHHQRGAQEYHRRVGKQRTLGKTTMRVEKQRTLGKTTMSGEQKGHHAQERPQRVGKQRDGNHQRIG